MVDQYRPVIGYPAPPTAYPPPPPPPPQPTGAAYNYAAPPPHPAAYYPPQPAPFSPQRATFLRRIITILIASLLISTTVILILLLFLRPRVPVFRVYSLNVTEFNLSGSLISGNWDIRFTVTNPNKKISLSYERIEAIAFYKSGELAETTMQPFVQGAKNETALRATFAALNSYVDEWVVNGIDGDLGRGSVSFNVRMLATVGFKVGGFGAQRRFIRVLCPDLAVGLLKGKNHGFLTGGSRKCQVRL